MLKNIDFFFFSPTGGVKKAGEIFCRAAAENVRFIDLGARNAAFAQPEGELAVFAMPVFAGRIPANMPEKLRALKGAGRMAVSIAVYGVRAYDDALLEMNDLLREAGFRIAASAALAVEHSIVRAVGAGRPDAQDAAEIAAFAEKVCAAVGSGSLSEITVPGNRPYRDGMTVAATPVSLPECVRCGACAAVCPTGSIEIGEEGVSTRLETCLMCMACTAACPAAARRLPAALQDGLNQKLGALVTVRRENEFYL